MDPLLAESRPRPQPQKGLLNSNTLCFPFANSFQGERTIQQPVFVLLQFRFADGVDKLLMIVGTLAAMITGCAFPVNLLFYGQVVNEFIKDEQDSISGSACMHAYFLLTCSIPCGPIDEK